jgi:hypothetical protein
MIHPPQWLCYAFAPEPVQMHNSNVLFSVTLPIGVSFHFKLAFQPKF